MPDLIASPANSRVKAMRKLRERKYREQSGTHLVEGVRAIIEGLDGKAPLETLLYDEAAVPSTPALSALLKRAEPLGAACVPATGDVLATFSGRSNPHQAIAVFNQRWHALDSIKATPQSVWIALEAPRDPGNLGTIIRTCEAAGANGVILIGDACDPYSPEAMRASTGALFGITLARASLPEFLDWASHGWELVGTGLDRSEDYRAPAYSRPTLIAMGTERDGLSTTLQAACQRIVRIPMRGNTDSLNLSIASGLMLFEVTNRKYSD